MAFIVKCAVWSPALLSTCSSLSRCARTCALCQWLMPLTVPLGGWEVPRLQPRMELCCCGQGQGQAVHAELGEESSCRALRLSQGRVTWALREPQTSLHHLTLTHNILARGHTQSNTTHNLTAHTIPHSPWFGSLVLGWQAGRKDPAGNAPTWAVFGCVCQRASPAPPEPCEQEHEGLQGRAALQHRAQGEHSGQDRVGEAGRTPTFFVAFIHTFMSWFPWGFVGVFWLVWGYFFVLVWFLHHRLNPEVSSCLSLSVPTYVFPKFPWSVAPPGSFVIPFVTALPAHSSDETGSSNHHRLLTTEKQSCALEAMPLATDCWKLGTYPGRMLLFHLFPKMNVPFQKPGVINLGSVYTWNGKAVFRMKA